MDYHSTGPSPPHSGAVVRRRAKQKARPGAETLPVLGRHSRQWQPLTRGTMEASVPNPHPQGGGSAGLCARGGRGCPFQVSLWLSSDSPTSPQTKEIQNHGARQSKAAPQERRLSDPMSTCTSGVTGGRASTGSVAPVESQGVDAGPEQGRELSWMAATVLSPSPGGKGTGCTGQMSG